jgi:hypothetical protein
MNSKACTIFCFILLCVSGFAEDVWHYPDGSDKIDRYFDVRTEDSHEFDTGLPDADGMDTTNTVVTLTLISGRELPKAIAIRVFFGSEWTEADEEAMTNWIPFQEKMKVDLGEGDGERHIYAVAKWNSKPSLTASEGEKELIKSGKELIEEGSGFGIRVIGRGPRKNTDSKPPSTTVKLVKIGDVKAGDVYSEANLKTNVITLNSSLPAYNTFKLHINNISGHGFVLYSSTNLLNWNPILTNLNANANSGFDFRDTNMANYEQRFFQVRPLQ